MRQPHLLPLRLLLLAPFLAWGPGACSFALGLGEEQCDTAADCTARGFTNAACESHICVQSQTSGVTTSTTTSTTGTGGEGGTLPDEWKCLPGFMSPVATEPVPTEFQFQYATSTMVPPNLHVKLCSAFDSTCTSPVHPYEDVLIDPTGDGKTTFTIPPGFAGFLDVVTELGAGGGGGAQPEATIHAQAFLGNPPKLPPGTKLVRLTTETQKQGLLNLVHEEQTANHAVALVLTSDCNDNRVAGVKLTASPTDGDTVPFYFKNSVPSTMATETDAEGAAGFLNLPLGVVTIEARRAVDDRYIGTITVQMTDGIISYVPINPTTPN